MTFTKDDFTTYDKQDKPILKGWSDRSGAKLWHFLLSQNSQANDAEAEDIKFHAFGAYDLARVEVLVRYFHAASGYQ